LATRRLEIAVAGCGPGGLAAALLLHRTGHRVTLFERFDAPRPLGSGLILQPTGLAILEALGLAAPALESGARIERLFGRAEPSGKIVLDVRYAALAGSAFGLGIHRGTLFRLLFDSVVAEEIAIETCREIVATAGGRLRFADGGAAGPFDLIVDALGSQSPLAGKSGSALAYGALWATLDWHDSFNSAALEQRYRRASKMVGVLPIGRLPGDGGSKAAFFWSLRADDLPDWREQGLQRWKEEVLALWPATAPLLAQIRHPADLTFARYRHRTLRRPAEPGLVHLGDSWHSTSPQLGQGANMALLDAAALATALASTRDVSDALAAYVGMRRRHVRLFQAMSYLFTPFYQSDSRVLPLVRDLAGPLSRVWPAPRLLATIVAGTLTDPLRRIGSLSWRAPPEPLPDPRTFSSASDRR
jgi:2-polyprenyl-6-methoxyphenol hydroxylase-like FAD-dependent oxidoreductase